LVKELRLTKDQQSKIEMILSSSRQEFQEIREKSKPEEARIRIQSLLRQKIRGLLTESQRQKLDEMATSSPGEKTMSGRVWVLSREGQPAPVPVLLGVTDGTFSEVIRGDLQEGTEVIVEETSNKKGRAQGNSPPSMRGLR
jgi:HlyD family secretion protein